MYHSSFNLEGRVKFVLPSKFLAQKNASILETASKIDETFDVWLLTRLAESFPGCFGMAILLAMWSRQ